MQNSGMNGMMELVVIDIDGTLIRSDLTIGERTLDAIAEVKRRGIAITFATGRMISAARRYIEQVGVRLPIIALNGALVGKHRDGDAVLHTPIIEEHFAKMLPMLAQSEAATTIVQGDVAFGWNIDDFLRERLSSWIVNICEISPHDSPPQPTIAMVAGKEIPVKNTAEQLRTISIDKEIQLFLFPSIRYYPMWYLELRAAGVDKGTGLAALRNSLGIDKQDVLVIGDYLNDLPMFEEAGMRTAVSNAHADVVAAADYVSPLSCDRDGVGEILEKMVIAR